MEAEQRGHHRERETREDGATVGLERSEDGEGERGAHRDRGREADADEVDPGVDLDVVRAVDEQRDAR